MKPAVFIGGATVIVGKKTKSFVELAQDYQNSNGHYKSGDVLETSEVLRHGQGFVETLNTVYVLEDKPGTATGNIEVLNVSDPK